MREARDPASHGGDTGWTARGMSSRSDLGARLIRTFPACNYCGRMTTEVSDAAALSARLGRLIRAHRAGRGCRSASSPASAGLPRRSSPGSSAARATPRSRLCGGAPCAPGAARRAARRGRGPARAPIAPARASRSRPASGMDAWLVHADGREHRGEVYELHLPAGVTQRSEPHLRAPRSSSCVWPALRAGPLAEPEELGPGDAVWFAADVPHAYVGVRDARALCWMRYPDRGRRPVSRGATQPVLRRRRGRAGRVREHVRARARRAARGRGRSAGGSLGAGRPVRPMGAAAIWLGLRTRLPITIAWSTPGRGAPHRHGQRQRRLRRRARGVRGDRRADRPARACGAARALDRVDPHGAGQRDARRRAAPGLPRTRAGRGRAALASGAGRRWRGCADALRAPLGGARSACVAAAVVAADARRGRSAPATSLPALEFTVPHLTPARCSAWRSRCS